MGEFNWREVVHFVVEGRPVCAPDESEPVYGMLTRFAAAATCVACCADPVRMGALAAEQRADDSDLEPWQIDHRIPKGATAEEQVLHVRRILTAWCEAPAEDYTADSATCDLLSSLLLELGGEAYGWPGSGQDMTLVVVLPQEVLQAEAEAVSGALFSSALPADWMTGPVVLPPMEPAPERERCGKEFHVIASLRCNLQTGHLGRCGMVMPNGHVLRADSAPCAGTPADGTTCNECGWPAKCHEAPKP